MLNRSVLAALAFVILASGTTAQAGIEYYWAGQPTDDLWSTNGPWTNYKSVADGTSALLNPVGTVGALGGTPYTNFNIVRFDPDYAGAASYTNGQTINFTGPASTAFEMQGFTFDAGADININNNYGFYTHLYSVLDAHTYTMKNLGANTGNRSNAYASDTYVVPGGKLVFFSAFAGNVSQGYTNIAGGGETWSYVNGTYSFNLADNSTWVANSYYDGANAKGTIVKLTGTGNVTSYRGMLKIVGTSTSSYFNLNGTLRAAGTTSGANNYVQFDGSSYNTFFGLGKVLSSASSSILYSATDLTFDKSITVGGIGYFLLSDQTPASGNRNGTWKQGAARTLTLSGATLNPGNDASAAGIFTIVGNLAGAADADGNKAQLVLDVFGASSFDKLTLVKVGTAGTVPVLGGNITGLDNIQVVANIAAGVDPDSLVGQQLFFLTCLNDLTGQSFADSNSVIVTGLPQGYSASVVTGNGTAYLTFATPEPATTALLIVGGAATFLRRRRNRV